MKNRINIIVRKNDRKYNKGRIFGNIYKRDQR
jgi:hypothetical protein